MAPKEVVSLKYHEHLIIPCYFFQFIWFIPIDFNIFSFHDFVLSWKQMSVLSNFPKNDILLQSWLHWKFSPPYN